MLIPQVQGTAPAPSAVVADRPAVNPPATTTPAPGTRSLLDAQAPVFATPTRDAVVKAVTQGNRAMAALSASLSFEVDSETHMTIVKVIDTSDNSVLRQIPSQEMLDIARALDRLQGLLLRDKA
jgi:flagellar protein FlaG